MKLKYLTFLDDSFSLAEQMIFQLSEEYSSDYFIAKAFLLLADIYIAQSNNFQAKATLESIIENHEGDDLVNIARKKWEQIVESEVVEKIIIEDQFYIDIIEDSIYFDFESENDTLEIINKDFKVITPDSIKNKEDVLEIFNENMNTDEIE